MPIVLRDFSIGPGWEPLLERLPGWEPTGPGTWSDGDARVTVRASSDTAQVRFHVAGAQDVERLSRLLGREGQPVLEATSPSGLRVTFALDPSSCGERPSPTARRALVMNHVALLVADVRSEQRWFEQFLGPSTVLARDRAWDPVERRWQPDVHLYRDPAFYVTLRQGQGAAQVEHMGWMAASESIVDGVAAELRRIGWPIVVGPTTIDGSYLVHFRAPDGHVHDVFSPTAALLAASA